MGAWGYLPSESDGGLDEWSKITTILSPKKTYTQWWNSKIPTLKALQGGKSRPWQNDDQVNYYYIFFEMALSKSQLRKRIKWAKEDIKKEEKLKKPSKSDINREKKYIEAFELLLKKGIPKSVSKKAGMTLAKAIVQYEAHNGFQWWNNPKERKNELVKLAKKLGAPASAFKPIAKKKAPAKKKTITRKRKAPAKKKTTTRKRKTTPKKSGRILRGKRKSPSTSATSVKVGTKRRGGDGKMYVCKTYKRGNKRVKRWVRA